MGFSKVRNPKVGTQTLFSSTFPDNTLQLDLCQIAAQLLPHRYCSNELNLSSTDCGLLVRIHSATL